ncbi:hypothetical protein SB778_33965 [Paraburkholderia sp. SIMBA_050]|uniref:hypothetical protein n=1 Tax=Paraburkholderia TaxID=1822464 RepID=UPI0032183362
MMRSDSQIKLARKDAPPVTFAAHWWGFTISLSEAATQLLNDFDKIAGQIIESIGDELTEGVAELVVAYIKLRTAVIKLEDNGSGIKLVSPWIAPTLLIPFPNDAHFDDGQLRWSVYSDGSGWSDEVKMNNDYTEDGPSLAVHDEKLFCVARGAIGDETLYWMYYDIPDVVDGQTHGTSGTWTSYAPIRQINNLNQGAQSQQSPGLASYNGQLWCVYQGAGSSTAPIYVATFNFNDYDPNDPNKSGWTVNAAPIPNVQTNGAPAVAVYRGILVCVYVGADNALYSIGYNPSSGWGESARLDGTWAGYGESTALCVYNDRLYCVYRGGHGNYWYAILDDQSWRFGNSSQVPGGVSSTDGPFMAVFEGKMLVAHRSNGNDETIYVCTFDGSNWTDVPISGVKSAKRPGIVHYQQPGATQDQLLMMHRGIST